MNKLDFKDWKTNKPPAMHRVIHSESIKVAMLAERWAQKKLAGEVGVRGQAVTNWMKGVDFLRPPRLLKLASALPLGFDRLVLTPQQTRP